jgi:hypothetical protein
VGILEGLCADNGNNFLPIPIEQPPLFGEFIFLDDTFGAEEVSFPSCNQPLFFGIVTPTPFLFVSDEIGVGGLNLYDDTFAEVPKSPNIGVFSAPSAEFNGYIVALRATASVLVVARLLGAPIIIPLLPMQPLCTFYAELVM